MWDKAAYWHGLAQSDARMTGDADLIAYTLSHAGHLHADLGDGRSTVDLCDAALSERGRLSARIQVTIKCQQAHGYALIGERRKTDQLLDAASLAVEHVDPTVPWGSAAARNARYFEVQRATCYGRLGLHHEAVRIWEQINATMPATARRDTGVFLARQATSYASTGEPEHAVPLARQSSAIARETGSARHRQELGVLRAAMQPWATTRIGREFDQAIAA
ncbi:hypothetical protein WKI65_23730 [Streptomyces sp. MS1.AVA.3]|uniref:hypothetical protein n=1 Tax=Streptomyces decoyicus TaxID=249567 RepID=UPI0030BDADCE